LLDGPGVFRPWHSASVPTPPATCESDCYAPVMTICIYPSPGSDQPQVISPHICLHTRARYAEGRTSRKTFRRPVSRPLRDIFGIGAIVLERVALEPANHPPDARAPFQGSSYSAYPTIWVDASSITDPDPSDSLQMSVTNPHVRLRHQQPDPFNYL